MLTTQWATLLRDALLRRSLAELLGETPRALTDSLTRDSEERADAAAESDRDRAERLAADAARDREHPWFQRQRALEQTEIDCERGKLAESKAKLNRLRAGLLETFGAQTDNAEPAGVAASEVPAPPSIGQQPATPAGDVQAQSTPAATTPRSDRIALTQNPRKLRYHRTITLNACAALHKANGEARRVTADSVQRLNVPRAIYQLGHDLCDSTDQLAGSLDWVRRTHGPAVALEVEAAALYRERGGKQHDDWSAQRARRKAALLVVLLMAPHEIARSAVSGGTNHEPMLVTAGVPQTLLLKILHSGQREPYSLRTLQRDLAQIDQCTDLLMRWRTPIVHAEAWEHGGAEHGVINRYCVRAGMIREQWRRACDAGEALVKRMALQSASWMVWKPAPDRGSSVPLHAGAPS